MKSSLAIALAISALFAFAPQRALAYPPASWVATGNLSTPQTLHTATLLPSGKVLIVGGEGGSAVLPRPLASAELYDPATNAWTPAGSMQMPRWHHAATLLGNGKVLITGGTSDGFASLASTDLYDPATNLWTSAAPMATPRLDHTATLLASGDVLVAGGFWFQNSVSSPVSTAELYHPATNTWTSTGSLMHGRAGHQATMLLSGTVLATSGTFETFPSHSDEERYDPSAGVWSSAGNMGHPTASTVRLADGRVMAIGESTDVYDPITNSWLPGVSMLGFRTQADRPTATLLLDGRVIVVGNSSLFLDDVETFDPVGNVWALGPRIVPSITGHSATLLQDGTVLVPGGTQSAVTALSQRFGLDTDLDGVFDVVDNCPTVPNLLQTNTDAFNTALGLPGQDNIGDACDPDISGDGYGNAAKTALGKDVLVYCPIMRADVDADGTVTILDLSRTAQHFGQTFAPTPPSAGIDTGIQRLNQDADGVISILDLSKMASKFGQPVSACP